MPSTNPPSSRIYGTGEMAERTRAFDWSTTPVGPIDTWPDLLLNTVNTLLASRHPMFLWWGSELVQFYNDGYRPSIGPDKDPKALGQCGPDCWPEIWHIIGPEIRDVMTTGTASWHEDQLVPIFRNGKIEDVYWTYSYSPVRTSSGEICGTIVVCSETTGRVLAENALSTERTRLFEALQQAPAFFTLLEGPNHVFKITNPPYEELLGRHDIIGKSVAEAVPEAAGQGFLTILDRVYTTGEPFIGNNIPIELARTPAEPLETRYLDFTYQPRREPDGTISGIIVLGIDVTDRKKSEEALVQTEKLAAVGRLASSIAHEINNPLEAVTNLLYLAQQCITEPDAKRYLHTAEVELRRVSVIANQTLRFYRQATNPRPITPTELIEGTLPLYQGKLANSNVTVERRDRASRPLVCFDGEIRQVLSNLVGNAIDAMSPNGGRLVIRSRIGTDWLTHRHGVIFTVADTGSGMAPHTLARIFKPFFTTKGLSGTGLGLWISHEIIQRHHGTIRARSSQAAHHGTVFTLFLPCEEPH